MQGAGVGILGDIGVVNLGVECVGAAGSGGELGAMGVAGRGGRPDLPLHVVTTPCAAFGEDGSCGLKASARRKWGGMKTFFYRLAILLALALLLLGSGRVFASSADQCIEPTAKVVLGCGEAAIPCNDLNNIYMATGCQVFSMAL